MYVRHKCVVTKPNLNHTILKTIFVSINRNVRYINTNMLNTGITMVFSSITTINRKAELLKNINISHELCQTSNTVIVSPSEDI